MFIGQSINLLDEKFRLVLPTRYREDLGSSFFIVRDFDSCLILYPSNIYAIKSARISQLDDFLPEARAVKREFFGHSFEGSMDKQGRIQLPRVLLEKLGINREVVLLGMSDHLEIWDSKAYMEHENETESNYSNLASKCMGLNNGK